MKKIGVLHITDLHCFGHRTDDIVTVKEKTLSEDFKKENTYKNIFDVFYGTMPHKLTNQYQTDVIACTGDLGVGKEKHSFKLGIDFLEKLRGKLDIKSENVIVSPGNHDLDREKEKGEEFLELIQYCKTLGFTCPNWKEPDIIPFEGISFITLNTCLGGSEHAIYGLPTVYWDSIKDSLKRIKILDQHEEIKKHPYILLQLQALDIPAIGNTQIEAVLSKIKELKNNFFIILTHHNPLPTLNIEIRPYANLIDSGSLIYQSMEKGHRVFILHGHSHCDSALTASSPEIPGNRGFVATIGDHGLHCDGDASATHILFITDDSGNFLAANVTRFKHRGRAFMKHNSFRIIDSPNKIISDIKFDALGLNQNLPFQSTAKLLGVQANDHLAEDLLRLSTRMFLSIENIDSPIEDWIITRLS